MPKSRILKYLIWFHILLMVFAYNIVPFLNDETYHYFFKMVSMAWLIPAIVIIKLVYNTEARCAGIAFIGLTLNNFLDEFFFNPTKLQLNEFLLALVIFFWIARDEFKPKKLG